MKKGLTLLEVLLVIAIFAIIFAFSAPFALNFYRTQLIEETRSEVIFALQAAKHGAVLQKNDSNFGVHFMAGNYTIFQGNSYANRIADQDEVFLVKNDIIFSGLTDIVFLKQTGLPSATGTIILTNENDTRGILVGNSGDASKIN